MYVYKHMNKNLRSLAMSKAETKTIKYKVCQILIFSQKWIVC